MTPGIPGAVRQAQAPIKKPVLRDEDSDTYHSEM
jgi:hypothetical protein